MSLFPKIIFFLSLLAVFFLPLIVWDIFLYPSTFPKTIFFYIMVDLMLIFWLPLVTKDFFRKFFKKPLPLFVIGFFIAALISSVFGVDFQQSLWSSYERMMGLWTLGHIVIFFLILATALSEAYWLWLFRALVLSAALVALIGFGEGRGVRIESTLRNSAFLASFLFLSSIISLWLLVRETKFSWQSLFLILAAIPITAAMIFTGTRGAMVAWGFVLIYILVFIILFGLGDGKTLSIKNTHLRKLSYLALALITIAVFLGYIFRDNLVKSSFDPLSRLASISLEERTSSGRFTAWKVAWSGWQERFFLGWGVENFNILFDRYYDANLFSQEPWYDRAHNIIFDVGSTTGIFGLGVYLGIYGAALFALFKKWKKGEIAFWTATIFSGLLLGHLVQNLFVFDSITALVVLFLVFAYIYRLTNDEKLQMGKNKISLAAGGILTVSLLFFVVWTPVQENRYARSGYAAFAKGADKEGISLLEKALQYRTYGDVDVDRAVTEYVFDFIKQGGKRDQKSLKRVIDYAIEKMDANIRAKPQDVKWYMYQGQLYNLGAFYFEDARAEYAKHAEERFLQAQNLSPQRHQIYLEIAQARKVQGSVDGMWKALEEAKKLIPDYSLPHLNALFYAIELEDPNREKMELEWLQKNSWNDPDQFLNNPAGEFILITEAYFKKQRFNDAVVFQKKVIEFQTKGGESTYDPVNVADMYENLAVLYKAAGNIEEARKSALKVYEFEPTPLRKKKLEDFIKSL